MDVRRDYRITVVLSWFKKRFPCDENGELEVSASESWCAAVVWWCDLRKVACSGIDERMAKELCDGVYNNSEGEVSIQFTLI